MQPPQLLNDVINVLLLLAPAAAVVCLVLAGISLRYEGGGITFAVGGGFTKWMLDRDRVAGGNLRTTLRLLKYMRDFKGTFDVPSVILTVLVGGRVNGFAGFFLACGRVYAGENHAPSRGGEAIGGPTPLGSGC